MEEEVKSILGDNIIVNTKNIPVGHLRYEGKSKTFITWTLLDESPIFYGDDEILCTECPLDIDIFSDSNYLDIVKEVKKIMKNNGWLWYETSSEMYEEETELYHRTLSFKKERNE